MKRISFVFLLGMLLFCSACSPSLKLDTTEKIKAAYDAHEALFNQAAEALMKYEKEEHIRLARGKEKTNADLFVVKEFKGIYIEASDSLTDADFQAICEACAPLFSALEASGFLSGFGKYGSRAEFMIEGPTYGNAAELFYFPDASEGTEYRTQRSGVLQITPHWYAEICHS